MTRSRLRFLLLTAAFGIAHTQAPLYTLGQNQYFLHGLAVGGFGLLSRDWLANTADPTPFFSLVVALTYRFLDPRAFYLCFLLLRGIFLYAMFGIASRLFAFVQTRSASVIYVAVITGVYSTAVLRLSLRILGFDVGHQLTGGVALQKIFQDFGLEPGTFGVLLMLSVYLFLINRPYGAIVTAALAATFHPTYLLSAAVLTLSYMVASYLEDRRLRGPLLLGLTELLLVIPIAAYEYTHFRPASSQTWGRANDLLVHFRIPHHAVVGSWFGPQVVFKIVLVLGAIYLVRSTRLLWPLLLSFLVGTGLTLLQLLTDSDTLALTFPWRVSVYLVPISSGVILAALLVACLRWLDLAYPRRAKWAAVTASILLIVFALSGVVIAAQGFAARRTSPSLPMMTFVAGSRAPGDLALIPTDLEDFRLSTGVPVVVDFKSIPYRDVEVLEWYGRLLAVNRFYEGPSDCTALHDLARRYGVTFVVLESRVSMTCPPWRDIFQDRAYTVYKGALNR